MPRAKTKSCGPRSRSFAGCVTCRKRKIKCDEGQPSCGPCKRSRIACGGYGAIVRFVFYGENGELVKDGACVSSESKHGRRVLFEDTERAGLSAQLQRMVAEDHIDQTLDELDSKERFQIDGSFQTGPFGVFSGLVDELPPLDHDNFNSSTDLQPIMPATSSPMNNQTANAIQEGHLKTCTIDSNANYSSISLHDSSPQPSPAPHIHIHLELDINHPLSQHTTFLLEYYKSQLGTLFSPLRVRQSPWSFLHFPCALSTLSELSICKTATPPKTSLLFSILAVSAFNLDRIVMGQMNSTNYWWQVGDKLRHQAQMELSKTAEMEVMGSRKGRYLHILMAMLKMVTISVVSGQQAHARSMLLQAENFIAHRGLGKARQSRKAKVLHYIYLYLRVIEESTHIYPYYTPTVPCTVTESMLYPSLRTHSLLQEKDIDTLCGDNFEAVLFGDNTTSKDGFAEIYGFPQHLLSLISRTTYLSNAIASAKQTSSHFIIPTALEEQCRKLETEICEWTPPTQVAPDADDPFSLLANQIMMPHLISAIHSAIIIFFYRKIRKIHPLMVQAYAEKTISNLEQLEREKRSLCLTNCGIVWPGFIAAAEAVDGGLQERARVLLRGCAKTTGMRNFDVACDVVEGMWRMRREGLSEDWGVVGRPALVLT